MRMRHTLIDFVGSLLIGMFLATAGEAAVLPRRRAWLRSSRWGLPPLPTGIGSRWRNLLTSAMRRRVSSSKAARYDTQGNLWFVAIGSGWVSYLTADGKLVPVFNCNPPSELGQTCEPQGARWYKRQALSDDRGIAAYLVYGTTPMQAGGSRPHRLPTRTQYNWRPSPLIPLRGMYLASAGRPVTPNQSDRDDVLRCSASEFHS